MRDANRTSHPGVLRAAVTARLERARGRAPRRTSSTFTLVVGFAVGVLVATLMAHDSAPVRVEGQGSAAGAGVGEVRSGDRGASASTARPGDGKEANRAGAGAATSGSGEGGAPTGTVAGEGDGSGGGGEAPAVGGTPTPGGGTARGVTSDTIKIGAGVLDIGALRHLGPAFDNGDGREHMEAWLEGARRDGLLPIHGRDLEVVYRSYAPAGVDAASQREACVGFVKDDKVFAVLAGSNYQVGAECVAREFRTPLLTSDGVPEEVYRRSDPFLFTFMMSETRLLRNWIHWAHHNDHLDGKTIGLYYESTPHQENLVSTAIAPALESLGYELAATHTTDQGLGGPQDAVAVQKFQTSGVDLALLLTSKAGFQQQAQGQGYDPDYLDSDFLSGTTNTATSTYPEEQWDGTFGMTGMRYGEWKSGVAPNARAQKCASYYEEYSGRRIDANEREAEWVGMNKLCDAGWALVEALEAAGPELTPESFVRGMETIRGFELGVHLDVSFEPGRHHGTNVQRSLRWEAGCGCWKTSGGVSSLWVG